MKRKQKNITMQLLKKYCDPAYMCKNQIKNNYTCTPQTAVCETE